MTDNQMTTLILITGIIVSCAKGYWIVLAAQAVVFLILKAEIAISNMIYRRRTGF